MHSGHPSAGRRRDFRRGPSRGILLALLAAVPVVAEAPGGFVEDAESLAVRTPWTVPEIRAFLPDRGAFVFPAPYGAEALRVTNAGDCGGADCLLPLSPDRRRMNNHRDSKAMLILLGLRGAGPALFAYDKSSGQVRRLGPLFDPASPHASGSADGWYFSATRPSQLYVTGPLSSRLERYDVRAKSLETVFDAAAQFGPGHYIWRPQSSDDDDVHSATLRALPSHEAVGCLAYREDSGRFSFYPALGDYAGCQVDASGRWLEIDEELDGVSGRDRLVVDLPTGAETIVPRGEPDARRRASFSCDVTTASPRAGRASEIVCRTPGSSQVLVVAQAMASGLARDHRFRERSAGSLDVSGRYFLWLGEADGRRADAFVVKLPAWPRSLAPSVEPNATNPQSRGELSLRPAPAVPVGTAPAMALPDPLLLPLATTLQIPLTAAYNLLNVRNLPAGGSYLDPTSLVKVYKLTSASFPASGANWGHDYSEGGDEVSLPYNGNTRAILVYSGGSHWLIDFTPGTGVSNPRQLTGSLAPFTDLAFTFSSNPATPYYAYASNGGSIVRFDLRTMAAAPGNGWPQAEANAVWLHQSENDGMFVWMRGATGSTMVAFEPGTGTKKTYTNAGMNEPRIDRAGRYVGVSMNSPLNGLTVWDFNTGAVAWTHAGDPGIPFAHVAALRRRWMGVDWNLGPYPCPFSMFSSDVANSATRIGGPANGTLIHGNGNWIQRPANLNDQWALFTHYGSLRPPESYWLAPGAMIMVSPNGGRRLLGHPYNTTSNYTFYSFAKFSPDGAYVLFTSDMNGSGRSDLFLAEVPQSGSSDTNPPTVSITAPGAGATVSGTAVAVSATASDNVGVAGVQFRLDGSNLGAEDTSAPYGVSWNTTLIANGSHGLTAVARDAAGNSTTSGTVTVTVNNVDTVAPVISAVSASAVSSLGATIAWTTNEPADSQVEYGPTTAYGSSTAPDPALIVTHSKALSGLTAGTLYHYRVRSRDAAGNLTVSGDFTFTTLQTSAALIAALNLNEGSGTAAADSSGNGHPGTLLNGAAWTAGTTGTGVALDGTSQYVRVAHAAALDAYPLSMAVWFKTTSAAGVRGLANKYVGGSGNGYQVFINDGNLCAWYYKDLSNYVSDNGGCTMSTPGYNDGAWHQATLVVDGLGGRLYVDGVQKATQPWTGTPGAPTTAQDLRLGHYPGAFGGTEYLPGTIDDFRLYGRALVDAEVAQLYNTSRPVPDTAVPVLSGVGTSGIGPTGATVAWTTDEPADSQVEYGLTTAYGSATTLDPTFLRSHSQGLTGLASGTLYHYRVKSRDPSGNLATSSDFSFLTLDSVPPVLSSITATAVTASSATITWTTNEPADTQVEYGPTTAYGSATTLNPSLVLPHSQGLSGLTPATLYHYRVKSRDGSGNLATSGDFTLTTLAATDPNLIAHLKMDEGSGLTVADASGSGNAGALVNGPAWTSGAIGQAVGLDGVDDYLRIPHAAALNAFPLTASVWFKTTTNTGVRGLVNKYVAGSFNGYQIFFNGGNLCAWYMKDAANYVYDATSCTLSTSGFNDGVWHLAVLVVDTSGGRLYVDGAQRASRPWTGTGGAPTTAQELRLGDYAGARLAATLDEFRLYTRSLAVSEVLQLYNAGAPAPDTTPPLLSGVGTANLGTTLATVSWTSNEPADSQVDYGPTTAYGSSTTVDPALVLAHAQTLTGLTAGTLYHYRVRSRDASGNPAVSADFTFTTASAGVGLVDYLKMDEGSGATASDSSGTGNLGTVVNGGLWTAGANGLAVSLDGIDDYVRVNHSAALNAFPITTSVWFKTTSNAGLRGLVSKYVPGSFNGYHLFFNGGNLCAWYMKDAASYVYDATSCPLSAAGYNDGVWHQAVLVVDAAGGRLYVDGAQKASRAWTGAAGAPTTTQSLHLGDYAGARLPAVIDEFRVYNRALSASEVLQMYNSDRGSSLVDHLRLDEGTGTAAADASGNGNTGTLLNGAAWTTGTSGGAVSLDGIDDYVRVAHTPALNPFPLTVAVWFKTATTSGVRGLVSKYVPGSFNGYQLFFNGGSLCAWYMKDTGSYVFDGTSCTLQASGFNDNVWHQAVLVVDTAGGRLYVDGVPRASRPWTGVSGAPTTGQELRLGDYNGARLAGTIDELRIYNRALSDAEVLQLQP